MFAQIKFSFDKHSLGTAVLLIKDLCCLMFGSSLVLPKRKLSAGTSAPRSICHIRPLSHWHLLGVASTHEIIALELHICLEIRFDSRLYLHTAHCYICMMRAEH